MPKHQMDFDAVFYELPITLTDGRCCSNPIVDQMRLLKTGNSNQTLTATASGNAILIGILLWHQADQYGSKSTR
jgi:hypothetical protein